jgi:hypothetical protein
MNQNFEAVGRRTAQRVNCCVTFRDALADPTHGDGILYATPAMGMGPPFLWVPLTY